jgi:hypothetical protein
VRILLAVVAVILVAGAVLIRNIFPPVLSKDATEKDFLKNHVNIMVVTSYLADSDYGNVYINNNMNSGVMYSNIYGDVAVDDSRVVDAIDTLFKNGFSVIAKDTNVIHFLRSTRLNDFGSGIAYSIDGHVPNESPLQFLTMLEPLTEPSWYYYEEDFIEYKRNPSN